MYPDQDQGIWVEVKTEVSVKVKNKVQVKDKVSGSRLEVRPRSFSESGICDFGSESISNSRLESASKCESRSFQDMLSDPVSDLETTTQMHGTFSATAEHLVTRGILVTL